MGAATVQGADKVVVTSDNPRLENPRDIINDIPACRAAPECVETDRAAAIRYAVERAAANDIVLIAGKGHENYRDMQGVKHHFSDFEVAEKRWQSGYNNEYQSFQTTRRPSRSSENVYPSTIKATRHTHYGRQPLNPSQLFQTTPIWNLKVV